MALTICCNLFLTLWGSFLWILAIVHGSSEVLALGARNTIGFCNLLLNATFGLITLGFMLGAQIRFGTHSPEFIVMFAFTSLLQWAGGCVVNDLLLEVTPLLVFHQPAWLRVWYHPRSVVTQRGRTRLRQRAHADAEGLASRARRGGAPRTGRRAARERPQGSVGALLRRAEARLDRTDVDVSPHVARLREDWFAEAPHLGGKGTEFLARYMPYRLAEEVHTILQAESAKATAE